MQKMNFRQVMNAPIEKVWDVLWRNETYKQWTAAFSEGSTVVTNWNKGDKVLFLDGQGQGMVSRIAEVQPPTYMSFEHLGMVKDGVEDLESLAVKQWAGARETYTLTQQGSSTQVEVELDITEEHAGYFNKTFPLALAKVKELSEG